MAKLSDVCFVILIMHRESSLGMRRQLSAFTLIELLVVIAIIGVLAALLLPVLGKAKRQGQKAACMNNLRQLGIGLQSYVADNSAYPPYVGQSTDDVPWEGGWTSRIQAEIGDAKPIREFIWSGVWRCPSAPKLLELSGGRKQNFTSYGYNAFGLALQNGASSLGLDRLKTARPHSDPTGAVEPSVAAPSNMMAIGDNLDSNQLLFRRYYQDWGQGEARHQGDVNVLFCDGHVESPTLEYVFDDTSDGALSRWNRDNKPHRDVLLQ